MCFFLVVRDVPRYNYYENYAAAAGKLLESIKKVDDVATMTILHEEAISRMLLLRSTTTKKAAATEASIKLEKKEQLED